MKIMKLLITLILVISWATISLAADCSSQLFYIEKSTNSNIVVYEANVEKGAIDNENPLDIYWRKADSASSKALGWLEEKLAYGARYVNDNLKSKFYITSMPDKLIDIKLDGSCAQAVTEIDNHEAVLSKVYVSVTGSGLSSDVQYIELYGVDQKTQKTVTERIDNL
jgi:hypothetical protein